MNSGLPRGRWTPDSAYVPTSDGAEAARQIGNLSQPVVAVETPHGPAVAPVTQSYFPTLHQDPSTGFAFLGSVPPLPPRQLGDPGFLADHGIRYPYMTGAMANGIASCDIVEAMCRAGMLGSFGAAGLSLDRVTQAIDRLQATLADRPYCINLIHSPNEPRHELALAELFLHRGVTRVEASAYLDLTPAIVYYRVAGLHTGPDGQVAAGNRIIAKVSRVEVATKFLSPPPLRILTELLNAGKISPEQLQLAQRVPMCDDLIAEADSGGHTDNRPAITLLPTLLALRDRLQQQYRYPRAVRVGLAGGIATPASVAGAFALGAAFVVTGSINQACVESGSSDPVRKMLAEAGQADVTMAPAADMFEMGVKVQVLKRGTMFAMRGAKLYEVYRQYPSWTAIPAADQNQIEKTFLKASFDEIWQQTREFFSRRDPEQLARAEADPRHQMALVFRWYLGLSSRWANSGEPSRQLDYQVWCGPAMGAFNEWAQGSFLQSPENRRVANVARNLLYGACILTRRASFAQQGVLLPEHWFPTRPLTDEQLAQLI